MVDIAQFNVCICSCMLILQSGLLQDIANNYFSNGNAIQVTIVNKHKYGTVCQYMCHNIDVSI